jgi:hypothetical protein
MSDQDRLLQIAKELREFASTASGIPSIAGISPITLLDYANQLIRIAARMDDVRGHTVAEVTTWMQGHTDSQDTGAWSIARAIAVFEYAIKRMDQEEDGA